MEELRIEKLKQKILWFNSLMEEISQELTVIFLEGKEAEFRDLVLEMIKSLDKAQQIANLRSDNRIEACLSPSLSE